MKILTDKEYKHLTDEYDKVRYQCSCGHKVVIPYNVDKQLCSWCHNYVFKDKKDEFKYRFKEVLNNENYK